MQLLEQVYHMVAEGSMSTLRQHLLVHFRSLIVIEGIMDSRLNRLTRNQVAPIILEFVEQRILFPQIAQPC